MKNFTSKIQGLFIVAFLFIIVLVLGYLASRPTKETSDEKIFLYLDSLNRRNEMLYQKVDSLQKVKLQLYKEYTKVKLKYDTIQIAIDTMPDLDGTKLLFSISRQLTAKGVE